MQLFVDGEEIRRTYSLSAAPNGRDYRISVKREAGGKASNFLHDQLQVGDMLTLFPPSGQFTLKPGAKPVVLISGGVGITPTLAMLDAALAQDRPVHFIHCARNAGAHAFGDTVDTLAAQHPQLQRFYCYDETLPGARLPHAVGRLDTQRLADWLPAGSRDVDAYFLGPKPFMREVRHSLLALGVPEGQIHHEFFGPAEAI